METRRWINQSQPQTLYMATILLYVSAAIGAFFSLAGGSAIGLLYAVGEAGSAYGIANERRWGYILGICVVGFQLALLAVWLTGDVLGTLFSFPFLFNAIWPVAVMVLLLHTQSREYQRIWFK